jgi:hypothetical protein
MLLVLVSAIILGSESRGTRDHILLSQIRDSATWRARSPYLYPPGTWWSSYNPRHWVPFSSPSTTRRATVEVFEAASTLSLAYNISVRTAQKTLFLCCLACSAEDTIPVVICGPFSSNGLCTVAYLAVTAYQRVYTPQYITMVIHLACM